VHSIVAGSQNVPIDFLSPAELANRHLLGYVALQWPEYLVGKHHQKIAEHLEAVERRDITRLIITMPPRSGKPVWIEEPVLMSDGTYKRLGDIQVGDYVITDQCRPKRVDAVFDQGVIPTVMISTAGDKKVCAAPDHPFLTTDGWEVAGNLEDGDQLVAVRPGDRKLELDTVFMVDSGGQRHCKCLSVDEDHTFTAQNFVVHNTKLTSEYFASWYLGKNPSHQIIACTYSDERAQDTGLMVKHLVEDDLHHKLFPTCVVRKDSASKKKLSTTRNGNYFSVGVGGPIVGRGAHLLLLDDLIKSREEAESALIKRRILQWYRGTAYTRLMPGGVIVFITTRWSFDDLAGMLLAEEGDQWVLLNLPAIAEEDHDIIGRMRGEPLWPEMYPLDVLLKTKESIGIREWNAQYQQRPVGEEGGIIKLDWFDHYGEGDAPEKPLRRIQSWDTAYTDKAINDPSCCLTIDEYNGYYYIRDRFNKHLDYAGVRRAIQEEYDRWKPSLVLIENRASGTSLVQELKNTRIPIKAITPTSMQNKMVRAYNVSGIIEAGKVLLPKRAPWLIDFTNNLIQFPYGRWDDDVDALTQFLEHSKKTYRRSKGPRFWK